MSAEITLIKKSGRKAVLTKVISLNEDGTLKSDGSNCVLTRGTARRVPAATAKELAHVIAECSTREAIALGSLREGLSSPVDVTTKAQLKAEEAITRSRDFIDYRPGKKAWVLIDHDTKGMPSELVTHIASVGGVWNALLEVAPELATAERVYRASTSSGISRIDTGQEFPSSGGSHNYILVQDGTDATRFLEDLHARLWLAGKSWYMVGKSGQLLERSLVDRAVGGGERLCFEGPPVTHPPVRQDISQRLPEAFEGFAIDTRVVVPPLTELERSLYRKALQSSATLIQPEANKVRSQFIKVLAERLASERSLPFATALRIASAQNRGVLLPHVLLEFDDLGTVSVGDLLANPEKYIDETLSDPIEGPDYGTCKAKVMRGDSGGLFIHSFAHGRQLYDLRHDSESALAALDAAPTEGVVDFAMMILANADMEADEYDGFARAVAKKAGVGLRPVQQRMKKEYQERERARRKVAAANSAGHGPIVRPRPYEDEELTPTARFLDDLLAADTTEDPPMRDASGRLVVVREAEPWRMHLLTSDGANGEEDEQEQMKAPPEPSLVRLDPVGIQMLLEQHVCFEVVTEKGVYNGILPRAHIEALSQFSPSAIPTVRTISTAPLVDLSGGVIDGVGLDRKSGVFHRIDPSLRQCLPSTPPTEERVQGAVQFLLDEWLVDVALSQVGKLIAVLLALTLLMRALLPERPAFFVTAGQRGGGKTTLVNMIVQAVLGRRASANSWSDNAEERKKALFAYYRQGGACLVWDNIRRGESISCPHIEAALTASEISDRVLGESRTETVPATTIQIFTGNAIAPRGDMASRAFVLPLNVDRPDPENRSFVHPDPLAWTDENRRQILEALYVLLVYGGLNRPKSQQAKTRFKMWWKRVGWPVELAASLLGIDIDCTSLLRVGEAGDEEASAVSTALSTIQDLYGENSFTARDLVTMMLPATDPTLMSDLNSKERIEADTLHAALSELHGKNLYRPTVQQLGKLLQKSLVGRPGWIGDGNAMAVLERTQGHNLNIYKLKLLG